MIRTEILRVE